MRIAFLRSVDINQAQPALQGIEDFVRLENISTKIFYTDGKCNKNNFIGEAEKVDKNISCEELIKKILLWKADAVISISVPDNNSLRDSCIKEILEEEYKIPVIMHSSETTVLFCNKWMTNRFLKSRGFKVPDSVYIYGDLMNARAIDYSSYFNNIVLRVKKMKFPIIIKPVWDSMSTGIKLFLKMEEFLDWLKNDFPDYDMCVEQFIEGEQISIEVLGMKGKYIFQPMIRKGKNISNDKQDFFPFNHLRMASYKFSSEKLHELKDLMSEVANDLNICGSVEFEMIEKDGEYYVIEVNPRVSGVTNLSSMASGINSYLCLVQMALDNWEQFEIRREENIIVAEVPLNDIDDELICAIEHFNGVEHINFVEYHNGQRQYKILIKSENVFEIINTINKIKEMYGVIPENILIEAQYFKKN